MNAANPNTPEVRCSHQIFKHNPQFHKWNAVDNNVHRHLFLLSVSLMETEKGNFIAECQIERIAIVVCWPMENVCHCHCTSSLLNCEFRRTAFQGQPIRAFPLLLKKIHSPAPRTISRQLSFHFVVFSLVYYSLGCPTNVVAAKSDANTNKQKFKVKHWRSFAVLCNLY